jgi:sugar lactone lactonase YvrE
MGVQVFDRNGRSRLILPIPGGEAIGLSFGGPEFDTLYVSGADHRIYRRKVKVRGAPAWAAPIELPPASAG